MEKFFKIKERGSSVRTEIIAGVTTFLAMAYILAVNPGYMEAAGISKAAAFSATAISAGIATLCMAFFANYPVALASGMGLNAFFAYTVCGAMGYSYKVALTAVFIEGIIFMILSLFKFREALVNKIPNNLKFAITAGIGLFISVIALLNSGIVVKSDATTIALGNLSSAPVVLGLVGLLVIGVLQHFKVPGGILLGILITWVLGMASGALMADAVGTVAGAILGTSTVTSFVESSAGVAAGGKTGLASVVTAILFFLSLVLAPIFTAIPSFATTPAMLYVGLLMLSAVKKVDFDGDAADTIGAFLAIIMMPLTYSIANGIMFGMLSWVILKLVTGKAKDISGVMYISVLLFVIFIALKVAGLA